MKTHIQKPATALAREVGALTIAWNDMQFGILSLFTAVVPYDSALAEVMFFSIRSDRAQRDMVAAVVRSEVGGCDPQLAEKIVRKIADIEKKAGLRNDAIHAMWMLDFETKDIWIYQQSNRLNRHSDMATIKTELDNLADEYFGFTVDLFRLREELLSIKKFSDYADARKQPVRP